MGDSMGNKNSTKDKEERHMAILAKPSNRMVKVSASDSKDFKERFNKHVLTPDRIKECEAARRLFSHGRSK